MNDELYNQILNNIAEIKAIQKENYDPRKKEIGDYVKVWDGSYLTDMNNKEVLIIEEPFISGKFIVTSDNEYDILEDELLNNKCIRDLIITNINTKISYRVSSELEII